MDPITIAGLVLNYGGPLVVRLMDRVFGSKTGSVKFDAATKIMEVLFSELQKVVGPSVGLPGKDEQRALVQTLVEKLNREGVLKGHETPIGETDDALQGVALMLEGALRILRSR